MKDTNKKFKLAVLLGSLATAITPLAAHASVLTTLNNIYNIASNPQTSVLTLLGYIGASFMGLFVQLGAWLITLGLTLDGNVFTSATVQMGFSVVLSIANLGFVLGIIVIAIATILRSETYGIKQALWKLIVMAILVNFGLVITGPIVGVANNFANYFLNATGGADNFALDLVSSFSTSNLQQIVQQGPNLTTQATNPCVNFTGAIAASCTTAQTQIQNTDNTGGGDFLRNLSAAVFAIIFMSIIAFTLILIGILLVVRYVFLSLLLIVLPLAWLTWVFPKFNYWTKWWGLFLKWAMFPAIVLFFVYLAIQSTTLGPGGQVTVPSAQVASAGANNPATGIMVQTGSASLPQTILNEIVAVALALGGIFVANSLSLEGANMITHGAKTVSGKITGGIKGYTKRKWDRAKSYPQRTEAGRRATEAMQRAGINRGFMGRLITKPVRMAGNAVADSRKPGEKLLSEDKKKYAKYSLEEQGRRIGTADPAGQLAIMSNLKDAMKSKDAKVKATATQVFNNLPPDVQKKFDRLKTLYGKGLGETYSSDSKAKQVMGDLEARIEKGKAKGKDTSADEALLEKMREAEKEHEDTEREEGKKTRETIREAAKETSGQNAEQQPHIIIDEDTRNVREVTKFDRDGKPIKEDGGDKNPNA